MLVEMELREIQFFFVDVPWQRVLLQEKNGEREFPIYIGENEAQFLEMAVKRQVITRPLTHDLLRNLISDMGGQLTRVLVDDLRDETFFGKLVVRLENGREVLVDSRPSDALILAVKQGAPIFVEDHVLWEVAKSEAGGGPAKNDTEEVEPDEEEDEGSTEGE
jgi:bifunctional DNase/RNase